MYLLQAPSVPTDQQTSLTPLQGGTAAAVLFLQVPQKCTKLDSQTPLYFGIGNI